MIRCIRTNAKDEVALPVGIINKLPNVETHRYNAPRGHAEIILTPSSQCVCGGRGYIYIYIYQQYSRKLMHTKHTINDKTTTRYNPR